MADWTPPTQDRVEAYFKELNNWGRWGHDDQRGTANLITAAKRAQAHSLVRTGRTVSLARDIGPQPAIMYNVTFPSNRERADVVHDRRLRSDVTRQRDGAARPHERVCLGPLGGRDEVRGAALIVVTPAAPVVELLEIAFDAILRGWSPVGHRRSSDEFSSSSRPNGRPRPSPRPARR